MLESAYAWSLNVCDPVEYQFRQQRLLRSIAHYLLDRDKPVVDEQNKEEKKDG